jgi:hypothetical protein
MKTKTSERGAFIDTVTDWFRKRSRFWALVSFTSFFGVITLHLFLTIQGDVSPLIRQGVDSILVPLLGLFVFSMFWRGSIPTFLSLAGAASIYGGVFYVYSKAAGHTMLPSIMAHKYNAATGADAPTLIASTITSVSTFYFLIGIFALVLCLVIAFRPSFFYLKGTRIEPTYPVWTNDYRESTFGTNAVRLVPVMGLLDFAERHLVAKYKYTQVMIGAKIYFVSPDDWVPEGSSVVRDKESGCLLGIPKIPDGFNLW